MNILMDNINENIVKKRASAKLSRIKRSGLSFEQKNEDSLIRKLQNKRF